MGRKYTPDQIDDIGRRALRNVADSYDGLVAEVDSADEPVSETFGNGSLIPHEAASHYTGLWEAFRGAIRETPETLNAMGQVFIDIAASYVEDEDEIERNLDSYLDDMPSAYEDELT